MRSLQTLATLIVTVTVLVASAATAQTGGTTWCDNEVTLSQNERYLHVEANENVIVEKVEYWDGTTWKSASFASSSHYQKEQEIDLGSDYLQGTVFRVLLRYNGVEPSVAELFEGQGSGSSVPD